MNWGEHQISQRQFLIPTTHFKIQTHLQKMGKKSNPNPSIFLIFCLIIFNCSISAQADDACPYPCIPPPIAGVTTPTTGIASYPPPVPPAYYYPPSGGDTGYGGGGLIAPPPPDPILPYFPYYYRNGVHREPSDQASSSSSSAPRWTVRMIVFLAASFASSVFLSYSI